MINQKHINKYQDIIKECRLVAKLNTKQTFVCISCLLSTIAGEIYEGVYTGRGKDTKEFSQLINTYLIKTNNYTKINFGNIGKCIYKNLRCAIVHNSSIGTNILLAHKIDNTTHLSLQNGKIVLVAEDLLDDIENMLIEIKKDNTVFDINNNNDCKIIDVIKLSNTNIASGCIIK